jgi:hypothetical protein
MTDWTTQERREAYMRWRPEPGAVEAWPGESDDKRWAYANMQARWEKQQREQRLQSNTQ